MGGVRQFTSLLRKNVLLKTRRPCSTIFELTLPLILFMLLLYVRKRMDIENIGERHFTKNTVFPLSPVVYDAVERGAVMSDVFEGTSDSSSSVDNVAMVLNSTSDNGDSMSDEMHKMLDDQVCNVDYHTYIADLLEPIMSHTYDGSTLADHMLKADVNWTANYFRDIVIELQTINISKHVADAERIRRDYLTSHAANVEKFARSLDETIKRFRAAVDSRNGAPGTRSEVEYFSQNICRMGSWALGNATLANDLYIAVDEWEHWLQSRNTTNIAQAWIDFRDWMSSSGMETWINEADVSWAGMEGKWKPLDGISWGMSDTMYKLSAHGDQYRFESIMGNGMLRKVANDTYEGSLSHNNETVGHLRVRYSDGKMISNYRKAAQDAWGNDIVASVYRDKMMEPFRWSMENSLNMPDMMDDMADYFRKMDLKEAQEMAGAMDSFSWWISNFLHTRSALARVLGEFKSDHEYMDSMRDNMGEMKVNMPEGMRTDMGRDAYRMMTYFSENPEMKKMREEMNKMEKDMWDAAKKEMGKMQGESNGTWMTHKMHDKMQNQTMKDDLENMSYYAQKHSREVHKHADSLLHHLQKMLKELRRHNVTSVEENLLPKWERSWDVSCPKNLNSTKVGDIFTRTESNCPFYRKTVRRLDDEDLVKLVQEVNKWLGENASKHLTDIDIEFNKWQAELKKFDAEELKQAIIRTMSSVQHKSKAPTPASTPGDPPYKKVPLNSNACPTGYGPILNLDSCKAALSILGYPYDNPYQTAPMFNRPTGCIWHTNGKGYFNPTGSLPFSDQAPICEKANNTVKTVSYNFAFQLQHEMRHQWDCANKMKRRLQKKHDSTADILTELQTRKVLVAPYTGDAKKFIDLAYVELSHSLTYSDQDVGRVKRKSFLGALFRCPLVKSVAAQAIKAILEERMVFFKTEKELEKYSQENGESVIFALVIRNTDGNGNFPPGELKVDYAIRTHAQFLPPTSRIMRISRYAMFGGARISRYPYLNFGFAYIQDVMGAAVARFSKIRNAESMTSGSGSPVRSDIGFNIYANDATEDGRRMEVQMVQMPVPAYDFDRFIRLIQHTLPMMLILGWIYTVALLVKEVVYEKQERLRDVMRIMGLKTWVYWASWMASAMIQMTALVTFLTLILSVGGVIKHSASTVIFFFFWMYSLATVSFAMFISSFFSRAKVAAACGGLAYYVVYLPYSLFNRFEDIMSIHGKNAMCLLSSTALGIGMSIVSKWEMIEEGVHWDNLFTTPPVTYSGAKPKDSFCLGNVIVMLMVDTVFYQILAWYMEKVFPGSLGLPQPWYFPVLPSYWIGSRGDATVEDQNEAPDTEKTGNQILECWEAPPAGLQAMVKIRNLAKKFRNGKQALRGITLDLHQGTILGLLGHNGAGKSTTMAILTGLYPPSQGDVFVNGRSVRKDSIGVRKQLGVCLQHNALYEVMTVEEHLKLFCCLKSVPWNQMKDAVSQLVRDTGLEAKRHARSNTLSGGMKRKLSIGISLSGGSQVVTLDEPTAGVDATSRRDIWQLLSTYKTRRTILLSTHFMDEADILSDRIAIIAEGQITAIGSGMSLKRHYADSYMLTLVMAEGANERKVSEAVVNLVPEAKFAGSRGRELCFSLPFLARHRFPALFARLQKDEVRNNLGIDSYGLSAATMEEVFLQASSLHEKGLGGVVRNVAETQEGPPPQLAQRSGSEISTTDKSTTSGSDKDKDELSPESSDMGLESKNTPPFQEQKSDTCSADKDSVGDETFSRGPPLPEVVQAPSPPAGKPPAPEAELGPSSPHCMSSSQPIAIENPDTGVPAFPEPVKVKTVAAQQEAVEKNPEGPAFASPGVMLSGAALWFQQFGALFRKRAISVRRDRKAWASQLLLPAVFIFLALVIAAILEIKEEEPAIKLSTDMFIGTTAAGAVQASMSEHLIPFADLNQSSFTSRVHQALEEGKGEGDKLMNLDLPKNSTAFRGPMSAYLLENNQELLTLSYSAVSIENIQQKPSLILWFRNRAYHAIPVMVNFWNKARLRLLGLDEASVQAWNHPLPKSQVLLQEEMTSNNQVMMDLTVAITMILAMGFIPASFVVYLVHEKTTNGKHQQLLTGVSPMMYWLSSYAWDMVNFLVPMIVCFIIFLIFQVNAYSGNNSAAIFFLLLSYGICMTPCMYCVEPIFKVPSTAYVTLICCNIFTGTISVMAVAVLDIYQEEVPDLKPLNKLMKAVFPWLLPNFNLGRGMIDIASNHYLNFAYEEFGVCIHSGGECIRDPMSYKVAGQYIMLLILMAPVWFALRMLIEWGCCTGALRKMIAEPTDTGTAGLDDAVVKEAERVADARAKGSSTDDCLVISGLYKSFIPAKSCSCCRRRAMPFHAVRGVNVGVPRGECFGLLGINGAGKTTTMRMITGDTQIGSGDIQVGGFSVHNQKDRARRHLGYCPQFDALPDKLTCRETLALYARIRGVPSGNIEKTVQAMITRMCLEAHQNNTCEYLSGGNKRKLSTALSLIGEPDVVLLDEPSTGVDVGARRFLWDLISDIRRRGHAIVLTSHSMEECEVLCTRLTIMVDGRFQCLGTPTQLKAKYGGGYTLTVKADLGKDNHAEVCARVRDFVADKISNATLSEESVGLFRYALTVENKGDQQIPLAEIFEKFEKATATGGSLNGCVADYTVSQTSLEEVFLYFSHYQHLKAPEHQYVPPTKRIAPALPAQDLAPALPTQEDAAIAEEAPAAALSQSPEQATAGRTIAM